ncbi:MAG: glycoside hydrolase family 88 protein [Duncaniella sp.]|nr:glycoside hydrolase family 88 protein [Duncaniella sp.]
MRKFILLMICFAAGLGASAQLAPSAEIHEAAARAARYFIDKYPDVGAKSYVGGKERNSKIWTRSVFYEGLMNLYREDGGDEWLDYALDWGEFHRYVSSSDTEAKSHNADYQCCGQTYIQLYLLDPSQEIRIAHIKRRIDEMIATGRNNFWYWVDAIQMSMPVMALLGTALDDSGYYDAMNDLYMYSRDCQGGSKKGGGEPLFNTSTGLWYRDYNSDPPYRDVVEKDKDCYWSRGNGWAYMALARVMQFTPEELDYRPQYLEDFVAMSVALKDCQKPDGYWGVSLHAPSNFGPVGSTGPEITGTSLFVGGMAWGIRSGILPADEYLPAVVKGWKAMAAACHPDGKIGYIQGTGSKPEHGAPITYDTDPDFEDFGVGCWLWGATEVHALARSLEQQSGIEMPEVSPETDGRYYDLMGREIKAPAAGNIYIYNHRLIRYCR